MSKFLLVSALTFIKLLTPQAALAVQSANLTFSHPRLNPEHLSGLWGLPFIGLLLSITLFPLLSPRIWHHHKGWIAFIWAAATVLPLALAQGGRIALSALLAMCIEEYLPFVILILTLYTLSSGIIVRIPGHATPSKNCMFLFFATLSANLIGTTGAAMLFIRPLLQLNADRATKAHLVIFFIILVGNLGGSLSPLGDPPLFLGFLKGVPFFWPTVYLFAPFIVVAGPTLLLFYGIDFYFYASERKLRPVVKMQSSRLVIQGTLNIALLGATISVILLSGLAKFQPIITAPLFSIPLINFLRDGCLLAIAWLSWRFTPQPIRGENLFSWEPVKEVGILFLSIFITAMPLTALLQAGAQGSLAPFFALVQEQSHLINPLYFWLTGILSAFLDNAPTYLVFFSLAGGDPVSLTGPLARTLTAISCGAVFMGALTYIGNAPNFMVKTIAESHGIRMPSFFGYFAYACLILLPLFLILTWIIFF